MIIVWFASFMKWLGAKACYREKKKGFCNSCWNSPRLIKEGWIIQSNSFVDEKIYLLEAKYLFCLNILVRGICNKYREWYSKFPTIWGVLKYPELMVTPNTPQKHRSMLQCVHFNSWYRNKNSEISIGLVVFRSCAYPVEFFTISNPKC